MKVQVELQKWPLLEPFRITGYVFEAIELLQVRLETDGCVGWGEAAGVYYRRDTPAIMSEQIEALKPALEAGVNRQSLQRLLPAGGARNALDCALWDLEAQLGGQPAWQIAELPASPRPLMTTFTCSAAEPASMAATAQKYSNARAIKLKLTGESEDAERVRAVRSARPDVWLSVDANQGFTPESLNRLMPVLVETDVQLIEQPFPVGQEHLLEGIRSPIRFAADESVQILDDIAGVKGLFQVINIKLDKCGGLTEGLMMARAARSMGLEVMVGNMLGTSLAMAPAFVLGQMCDVVDLDGPIFLRDDRSPPVQYGQGMITCPASLWGHVRR